MVILAAAFTCTASEVLTWAPPVLEEPETLYVNPTDAGTFNLDTEKDYHFTMPAQPVTYAVSINGGRNIVMIGGEIRIPWQGDDPSISSRRMLKTQGATGTVHIEGLLGSGEDISEGIQVASPLAIVQIQNCRIMDIHARDQDNFTDNHPDLIQTWGNCRELRVDCFTGSTDYQALMLKADYDGPHNPVILKHVNCIGLPTARYLFWAQPEEGAADFVLEEVWMDVPPQRSGGLGAAVWPPPGGTWPAQASIDYDGEGREVATWPEEMEPRIIGSVTGGTPPGGDFVPEGVAGSDYVSPGYAVVPVRESPQRSVTNAVRARCPGTGVRRCDVRGRQLPDHIVTTNGIVIESSNGRAVRRFGPLR
jgi:hypothetical protein